MAVGQYGLCSCSLLCTLCLFCSCRGAVFSRRTVENQDGILTVHYKGRDGRCTNFSSSLPMLRICSFASAALRAQDPEERGRHAHSSLTAHNNGKDCQERSVMCIRKMVKSLHMQGLSALPCAGSRRMRMGVSRCTIRARTGRSTASWPASSCSALGASPTPAKSTSM